jgi:hypothetical protein
MPRRDQRGSTDAPDSMSAMPLLRAPSEEILALAQEFVSSGGQPPRAPDGVLQVAVSRVAKHLDDHDRKLVNRVARHEASDWGETALVTAIARRILGEQSVVRAEFAESEDPDGLAF